MARVHQKSIAVKQQGAERSRLDKEHSEQLVCNRVEMQTLSKQDSAGSVCLAHAIRCARLILPYLRAQGYADTAAYKVGQLMLSGADHTRCPIDIQAQRCDTSRTTFISTRDRIIALTNSLGRAIGWGLGAGLGAVQQRLNAPVKVQIQAVVRNFDEWSDPTAVATFQRSIGPISPKCCQQQAGKFQHGSATSQAIGCGFGGSRPTSNAAAAHVAMLRQPPTHLQRLHSQHAKTGVAALVESGPGGTMQIEAEGIEGADRIATADAHPSLSLAEARMAQLRDSCRLTQKQM